MWDPRPSFDFPSFSENSPSGNVARRSSSDYLLLKETPQWSHESRRQRTDTETGSRGEQNVCPNPDYDKEDFGL